MRGMLFFAADNVCGMVQLLVQQFTVLDTMTPSDFLSFR
jgi:tryptophan 2,3-dioxygenase